MALIATLRLTIFVLENVLQANLLSSRVLRTGTPHNRAVIWSTIREDKNQEELYIDGLFHLLRDFFMNGAAEIFHSTPSTLENYWRAVIWGLAPWFGVYSYQAECLPHFLEEFIDVPPFSRGDRH
jgi:hypothetical protein